MHKAVLTDEEKNTYQAHRCRVRGCLGGAAAAAAAGGPGAPVPVSLMSIQLLRTLFYGDERLTKKSRDRLLRELLAGHVLHTSDLTLVGEPCCVPAFRFAFALSEYKYNALVASLPDYVTGSPPKCKCRIFCFLFFLTKY